MLRYAAMIIETALKCHQLSNIRALAVTADVLLLFETKVIMIEALLRRYKYKYLYTGL